MTTLAPVIDLIGDIGSFALIRYAGDVWVVYLRDTGDLELHRSGDAIDAFLSLETDETRFSKQHVSAVVLGEEAIIVWVDATTDRIYLSKWQMGLRRYTQAPTMVVEGSSPSIRLFKDSNFILAYRNASGQHVYRVSRDEGLTWESPVVVDAVAINELGIDVYPSSENVAYWAEES